MGAAVVATPTLDVVPFADLRWLYSHGTSEYNGDRSSGSGHASVLTMGAGFVFSKKITVRPGIEIPTSYAVGVSAFAISLGYSLGGKK